MAKKKSKKTMLSAFSIILILILIISMTSWIREW